MDPYSLFVVILNWFGKMLRFPVFDVVIRRLELAQTQIGTVVVTKL